MKKEFFAAVFTAVVVCLTFAFAGCEGGGDGNTNTSPENDSVDGGEDTNGVLEAGLIVATAPNDFVGDFFFFFFEDEAVCTGVNVCKAEATGVVSVEFTRPDALFLTKLVKANPNKEQEVVWDEPGDWGLAPNGMYYDDHAKYEAKVKTWVQDGQILLDHDGTVIGAVKGSSFAWTSEAGTTYAGTISEDLKTISYHAGGNGMNEFDIVLTLVE